MKSLALPGCIVVALLTLTTGASWAQSIWSGNPTADAFVATGSAGNPAGTDLTANNYGGAGALAISPAGSVKGRSESLLKFDLAPARTQFDAEYGPGAWQISSITLSLVSNFGTAGAQPNNGIFKSVSAGSFAITWLSDDTWTEGTGNPGNPTTDGVSFASLTSILTAPTDAVGTYLYSPPGNNVASVWSLDLTGGLMADAMSGEALSLLLSPADSSVGYYFNSRTFGTVGNRPILTVTAVPEPSSLLLLVAGAAFVIRWHRRRRE